MTDHIASYIIDILCRENGEAEFSRGALASRFDCVPSQINYVIATRFSPEHGYIVETKRGGGGYIRISRVNVDRGCMLMHVVNSIGEKIDPATAEAFLVNLTSSGVLTERAAAMIRAAVGNAALRLIPPAGRDGVRSDIMKQCLVSFIV